MRRRRFVTILGGTAAAWLRPASAQQKTMPVMGFLSSRSPSEAATVVAAFHEGLGETGYVERQNLVIEYRWAGGRFDLLPALAADLVGRKVDVIVATGGAPSSLAAKSATSTIPIVFVGSDPVKYGLVASLSRPSGNVTGFAVLGDELLPKRLELLSEMVPQARVIALLVNPNNPDTERSIEDVQEAARVKGLQLRILKAGTESGIDDAFASFVQLHCPLVVGGDPFFDGRREQLVALASRHAVPAIYWLRNYATAGGLISYGPNLAAAYRQAGIYAGKILNGAKPADLPVQQPAKFELVINLKTAKELGLTVPQSILARADEVIE
jgi:ABC-type uncharacterized transport system substrate-binding protein